MIGIAIKPLLFIGIRAMLILKGISKQGDLNVLQKMWPGKRDQSVPQLPSPLGTAPVSCASSGAPGEASSEAARCSTPLVWLTPISKPWRLHEYHNQRPCRQPDKNRP